MRIATIQRETKETVIDLTLNLDGGKTEIQTGIGFFDHMLHAFSVHSGFGMQITCKGDLHVDGHHTVEDIGIVMGQAFAQALGDKRGITRFGTSYVPMDEALGFCSLDISNRPYLVFQAEMPQQVIGKYDACLTEEFMRAFANNGGITLHLKCEYGNNSHHITEALFKALARALKDAVVINGNQILSSKGTL